MQIYLTEDLYRKLKDKSRQNCLPMAQYIRESLQQYLLREEDKVTEAPDDPIWQIAGRGMSDTGDLSTEHDRHLYSGKGEQG
jgi:hypothetical protein